MAKTLTLTVDPKDLQLVGTGGEGRVKQEWKDGQPTGPMLREGASVHRLTGMAVSLGGSGLDGCSVETSTPLEEVPVGSLWKVEGHATVTVRADASAGINGGAPRGNLVATVFVEKLVPIGSVTELLAKGRLTGGEK